MTPEEIVQCLKSISIHNGTTFGRLAPLHQAELAHADEASKCRGFHALSDAYKCFFLETVQLANENTKTTAPDGYTEFVPRLVINFKAMCGADGAALSGYPLQAYTLLRNVFDNHVLTCAALRGTTDFLSIEGIDPVTKQAPPDRAKVRALRKATEQKVVKEMTGSLSNLSAATIAELKRLDDLFDKETHGAQLSFATYAMGWATGQAPMPVLPQFEEMPFALFLNRFVEVAWLSHRLIPNVQLPGAPFADAWQDKWRTLDTMFRRFAMSLTSQLGKGVGAAIVEFVEVKFPFNEKSLFPH